MLTLIIFPLSCVLYPLMWDYMRVKMGNPHITSSQFLTYVCALPFVMYGSIRFSGIYKYLLIEVAIKKLRYIKYLFVSLVVPVV